MAATILCLFREPLPTGIVVSSTGGVAQVRVEEDDRRVAEVTVKKPENGSWAARAASAAAAAALGSAPKNQSWAEAAEQARRAGAIESALGRGDALGTVELVIPAGMLSPERLISRVLRMFLPVLSGPT